MTLFLVYQIDDTDVEPVVYPYKYLDHAFEKVKELTDSEILIDEETNGMYVSYSDLNKRLNSTRVKIKCPFDNAIYVKKIQEF